MNVLSKIRFFINTEDFLSYLIGLVLSTLFLGYAPSSIALGLFLFFSFRYRIINRYYVKINLAFLFPMLLYVFFILTWFWSVDKSLTKLGLERTLSLFLVPLAFSIVPKISLKNFKLIFNIYSVSNLILGMVFLTSAFFNYLQTKSITVFKYHNLVSILDLNAIYVSLSFSLTLFYIISKNNKTIEDKIAIFFFLAFLLLLSSKTMAAVLLISILVYVFCNSIERINRKAVLIISIFTILMVLLGSITLRDRLLYEKDTNLKEILSKKEFGKVYPWTGSSIRLLQLRILKEQIEEESIFWKGFGLFASRDNVKKRHLLFNTYPEFHSYNYHNQYAQVFSETGVFGLYLLLVMLLTSCYKAIKSRNFLFIMFCIAIIMTFFTESLLWRQHGLFLFIMLYCILNKVCFRETKALTNFI